MAELEELKIKFDALHNSIKSDMKGALDERGVGGSEFHTNSILEAIKVSETKMLSSYSKEIPSLVSEESGTLVITDENNALQNVNDGISENDLANGGTIQDECVALVNRRTRTIQEALLSSRRLKMGYHNGRLQVLPPKWTFPKMNVKQSFAILTLVRYSQCKETYRRNKLEYFFILFKFAILYKNIFFQKS